MPIPEPTRDDVIAATESRTSDVEAEFARTIPAVRDMIVLAERERIAKIADDMRRNFAWSSAEGAVLQDLARRIRSGT